MSGLILAAVIGCVLGALIGRFSGCTSGACPLTANWKRGALYGAAVGAIFHFAAGGSLAPYREPKNLKLITNSEFDAQVTQAGKPVVVDFFATWCGPCKILSPRVDKLAGEFGDKIKFVSVNVDRSPDLANRFDVEVIPMLLFIGKDGKAVGSNVGLISESALRKKLEALVKG